MIALRTMLRKAFSRLGSSVTIIEAESRILPRDDAELASQLQSILEVEGIEFRLGTRAERIEVDGGIQVLQAVAVQVDEDRRPRAHLGI